MRRGERGHWHDGLDRFSERFAHGRAPRAISDEATNVSSYVAIDDLIVPGEVVEARQCRLALGLDMGGVGIGAGELLDRLHRVPKGDGEEIHLPVLFPLQ